MHMVSGHHSSPSDVSIQPKNSQNCPPHLSPSYPHLTCAHMHTARPHHSCHVHMPTCPHAHLHAPMPPGTPPPPHALSHSRWHTCPPALTHAQMPAHGHSAHPPSRMPIRPHVLPHTAHPHSLSNSDHPPSHRPHACLHKLSHFMAVFFLLVSEVIT